MADFKQTFVQRALEEYLQQVEAGMQSAITKNKVGVTGEGAASISHKILQNGGGALGQLSFMNYLRFIDMGAGRGHPLGGLSSVSVTLAASRTTGRSFVADKIRRPKKIYAKITYGKLNYLIGKLMYGYTEAVVAQLKEELSPPTPQRKI